LVGIENDLHDEAAAVLRRAGLDPDAVEGNDGSEGAFVERLSSLQYALVYIERGAETSRVVLETAQDVVAELVSRACFSLAIAKELAARKSNSLQYDTRRDIHSIFVELMGRCGDSYRARAEASVATTIAAYPYF
jgi:hypothetical protein